MEKLTRQLWLLWPIGSYAPRRNNCVMRWGACTDLKPVYRRLLKMVLEQLQFLDQQIGQLDQEMAMLLHQHQDAVTRLAEVPGLGVDSAQQILAEVGPTAATFPSAKCLSSWVGA